MTAKEVAKYFFNGTASYWKILQMAKAGKIPHSRLGHRVLFRRETLDGWMKDMEQESLVRMQMVQR